MLLPDSCLRFDHVFASSWSYDAVGVHHADHHRCLIHGNSLNGFIFFLYVLSKYFVLFDGRYRFTSYWVIWVQSFHIFQLLCLEDMEKNKRFPDHYTQKVDMSKAQNLRKHIVRVHHTHTHIRNSVDRLDGQPLFDGWPTRNRKEMWCKHIIIIYNHNM